MFVAILLHLIFNLIIMKKTRLLLAIFILSFFTSFSAFADVKENMNEAMVPTLYSETPDSNSETKVYKEVNVATWTVNYDEQVMPISEVVDNTWTQAWIEPRGMLIQNAPNTEESIEPISVENKIQPRDNVNIAETKNINSTLVIIISVLVFITLISWVVIATKKNQSK